jgi:hypothetical protein
MCSRKEWHGSAQEYVEKCPQHATANHIINLGTEDNSFLLKKM